MTVLARTLVQIAWLRSLTMSGDTFVLQYHHPEDHRYSIDYLTDERDEFRERLQTFLGDDHVDIKLRVEQLDDELIYLGYTWESFEGGYPDFDGDQEAVSWFQKTFTEDEGLVVQTILNIFSGILDEKEEQNESMLTYKGMDLKRIPEVLNRVRWKQPVPDVAAELLSKFVLTHPMPNTNHRTAIGLIDRYLTSNEENFEMPETGEEGEWYPWIEDFIYGSKILLTLRRRLPLFRWAHRYGYGAVERKEGLVIRFENVNLQRQDHYDYYTERHLTHSRAFVDRLLEEADASHLQNETDDGKSAFIDRLRGT